MEIFEFKTKFHYSLSALVQIMAWRRPGDKTLFEPILVQFTDACGTRVRSVKDPAGGNVNKSLHDLTPTKSYNASTRFQ